MTRAASFVLAVAVTAAAQAARAQQSDEAAARDSAREARRSTRRTQIFSGEFSSSAHGPYFVWLYPGITYRVLTSSGTVQIGPRSASLPPIRFSAAMMEPSFGAAFQVPESAEYRVESDWNGREAAVVRIYREDVQAAPAACAADSASPCIPGLPAAIAGRGFHITPSMVVGLVLFPVFLWTLGGSGRRF